MGHVQALAGGVLPGVGHSRPHLAGNRALVCGVGGGVLVLVSSLQARGAPSAITLALVPALQVAVVHCDEQVAAFYVRDRPVRVVAAAKSAGRRDRCWGVRSARASA